MGRSRTFMSVMISETMIELGIVRGGEPRGDIPFAHGVMAFEGGFCRRCRRECRVQCIGGDGFGIFDIFDGVFDGSPRNVDKLAAVGDCLLGLVGRWLSFLIEDLQCCLRFENHEGRAGGHQRHKGDGSPLHFRWNAKRCY